MSIFTELLPKINQISQDFTNTFNENLKEALECFDKFEVDFENVKRQAREKIIKEKSVLTKLQSINEDDGENSNRPIEKLEEKVLANPEESPEEGEKDAPTRGPKKRSKHEVDDMSSPEVDKRQKRNASVVAKNIISKQAKENMNVLKENEISNIVEKLEKVSILPEPMEDAILPVDVLVKQEVNKDELAMPPPAAPVPKARKAVLKEKTEVVQEEETGRRRTRTRKQTDTLPAPPVPSTRATRASSRNTQIVEPEEPVIKDTRPKRTRGRKKVSEVTSDYEKETHVTQDSGLGSPSDKPRPKRTRKGQKAAEKETKKEEEITKEEDITKEINPKEETEAFSPILESHIKVKPNTEVINKIQDETDTKQEKDSNVIEKENIDKEIKNSITIMDSTVVLTNGVYEHEQVTPKVLRVMNDTVVLEHDTVKPVVMDTTVVLDKTRNIAMDATVVLERLPIEANLTEDNSLLTDDSDTQDGVNTPEGVNTPQDVTPTKAIPNKQPLSAVKEKVQKFEELAARTTRTKTRAMAKKDDVTENVTPPDKISKVILSAENLSKMNSMIFNGKPTQVTNSATKPKSNIPTYKSTSSSTSKLSGLTKAREAAEEYQRTEKEDARRKKEALLEAKREAQKKKREEKMAAAAKEEAQMFKEVLQRQKEYNDKQKLKYNNRMTPVKYSCAIEPVYMADGFQFLNSDEDEEEDDKRPPPHWATSLERRRQLSVQARLEECGGAAEVARLFSVRPHCPDLRQIFPNIERARLKRTSSAVWRTPPADNRYKT
ncbi:PREDICTED: uncharacterized protein LOC106103202 [Papilio polytes]|uniref:uncharacterized protein LOC106103202 n=1 Tax=Papilio polytes TaxID=76194 RepID=UPI000676AC36|nr:PREDICTED: uncharacterized protein LOC106103202 [Papilio polytes]